MHVKLVLTFKNYNYERNEQFHNLWSSFFTEVLYEIPKRAMLDFSKLCTSALFTTKPEIVKKDDQEIKLSAILNIETWIKNDDTATLDLLQKGKLIKVEGFFKADTYTKDGKDFHVTKMTATKIELVQKTAKEA